jgi:hypothetical protein
METARMQGIEDLAKESGFSAHYLRIRASDNLMSSVMINGSHEREEQWYFNIYENSPYFRFMLSPANGKRYYEQGEKVTVELFSKHHKIEKKFRKSTCTPEKAIERIKEWIEATKTPIIDMKPYADEIAADICSIRDNVDFPEELDEEEKFCDIRLQVYPNGQYAIRSGDSSYDQDHRGFWGCSSVSPDTTNESAKEIALDLIDQAEEQQYMERG